MDSRGRSIDVIDVDVKALRVEVVSFRVVRVVIDLCERLSVVIEDIDETLELYDETCH